MRAPFDDPSPPRRAKARPWWLPACLLLWVNCPSLQAGDDSGVRLVHALGRGQGGLQVELDGLPWNHAAAMQPGEVSALRRLPAGDHQLRIARHGLEPLRFRVRLEAGKSVSLVCHAVLETRENRAAWAIRVLKLDDLEADVGRVVRFLHLGAAAREWIEFRQAGQSWKAMLLERGLPVQLELIQPRGYLPLRSRGRPLHSLPVCSNGVHVVILHDDAEAGLSSLSYRERPLIAPDRPPPLP